MSISVNAEPLEPATTFPYLGRIVAYKNSNWADLYQNIRKTHQRWEVVEKVVTNTGSRVQVRGVIYKAVVNVVILYGSEIWLVAGAISKVLEEFHHWEVR